MQWNKIADDMWRQYQEVLHQWSLAVNEESDKDSDEGDDKESDNDFYIWLEQHKQFYIYTYIQKEKKYYCDLYHSSSLWIHISQTSPGASAWKTAALLGMLEKSDASMDWSSTLRPDPSDCAILIAVSMLDSGVNPTCHKESTIVPSEPWTLFNNMRFEEVELESLITQTVSSEVQCTNKIKTTMKVTPK